MNIKSVLNKQGLNLAFYGGKLTLYDYHGANQSGWSLDWPPAVLSCAVTSCHKNIDKAYKREILAMVKERKITWEGKLDM